MQSQPISHHSSWKLAFSSNSSKSCPCWWDPSSAFCKSALKPGIFSFSNFRQRASFLKSSCPTFSSMSPKRTSFGSRKTSHFSCCNGKVPFNCSIVLSISLKLVPATHCCLRFRVSSVFKSTHFATCFLQACKSSLKIRKCLESSILSRSTTPKRGPGSEIWKAAKASARLAVPQRTCLHS